MATTSKVPPVVDYSEEIILEVRQIIGRVTPSRFGEVPMVVEAFKVAGQYLYELPLGKDQEGANVEFEYHGIKFSANAWVEGHRNENENDQS